MPALVVLLVLAAPDGLTWSEASGVAVRVPSSWTLVAKDDDGKVFVIEGPKLGPGVPRAVLRDAGAPAEGTLADQAAALRKEIEKRKGFAVVSEHRVEIDGFPAIRFGVRFRVDDAKGRGRVTIAQLGGRVFVLECSASARHFPATAFGAIERSLAVRWKETVLPGGLVVDVPAGWAVEGDKLRFARAMVHIAPGEGGLRGPDGAVAGEKLEFLGAARDTLVAEKEERGLRMTIVHADGWTAVFFGPIATYDDRLPTVTRLLRTARLPKAAAEK